MPQVRLNANRWRLPRSDFFRHSLTLLSGTVATQLVAALSAPFLGRLYRPQDYGVLGVFMALSGLVGVIASLQFPTALVVPRSDARARALLHLSIAGGVVIVIAGTGPLLVWGRQLSVLFDAPALAAWVPLIPTAAGLGTVVSGLNAYVNRFRQYRAMARSRLSGAVVGAVVSLLLGFGGHRTVGLFAGFFAGLGTTLVVLTIAALGADRDVFQRLSIARLGRVFARYRNFALVSVPAELLNSLVQHLPLYTISVFAGTAAAGLYSMTNRLLGLPNIFIANAVAEVFRQRASTDYATSGTCRPIYLKTARTLFLLGSIPALVLFLFAPTIFSIYLGPQWREAGEFARVLTPLFLMRFVVSPLAYVFYLTERQREDLLAHVVMVAAAGGGMYLGHRIGGSAAHMLGWYSAGYCFIYLYYLVRGYSIAVNPLRRRRGIG